MALFTKKLIENKTDWKVTEFSKEVMLPTIPEN